VAEDFMTVKVAINGFGRIGRNILRSMVENRRTDIQLVAINDLTPPETNAHLFKYDSIHGRFHGDVKLEGDMMDVGMGGFKVLAERDPTKLPWRDLGADLVLECTGIFSDKDKAKVHLGAGAKKVLVSAPSKGADFTVVYGVNHDKLTQSHEVISNASCTTNCLAPVAKVLHETVGIHHGLMTTIHAYTADQNLLDGPHKDLRRARAGAINMVPTTTGAAKAVGLVIPELQGRLHGYAVRVPLPTGSLVDLTVEAERPTSVEEVNAAFRERADTGELEGILAYSEEPMVATDIVGSTYSSVFDAPLTAVIAGTQVKVVAWYDNEWGYSTRLVELAERMLAPVPAGRP
jgi:glyceraldehyde 3-phosphate dehydrogenase